MALIITKGLTLAYDGKDVVSDMNITIDKGAYLCIVGENGSGKSTLTKALLGLISPKSGSVQYGDGIAKNQIGYMPQQTLTQRDFPASVEEIVLSGCDNKLGFLPFFTKKHKTMAADNMKTLGIFDIRKKCYNELSGGQQQRVLLARALCATDKILVLDEPVAGLDPMITAEFYEILHKLNKDRGITIVMVSHDISSVRMYATDVLHIHDHGYIFDTIEGYTSSEVGQRYLGGECK